MTRPARLALATAALCAVGIGPAAAHVTVNPSTAPGGGYGALTFRVPTESDSASTSRVQVFLPTDLPLAQVLVKPHPGWSFTVRHSRLATPITNDDGTQVTQAVAEVAWTADSPADAIKPGEYDDFAISTGPFPARGSMAFKTLQTYSDGSVVRWIDTTSPGEHPAPRLTLLSAGHHREAATSGSRTPLVLSVVALVVALAAAGAALLRRQG